MRRVALTLALGALVLPAGASASGTTGRLLVSLRAPHGAHAQASAAQAVIARASARFAGRFVPQIGLVTVSARRGASLHALARRLRADPSVRAVDVEGRATPRFVPNDPALTQPETATGTPPDTPVEWWVAREDFPAAWDITRGTGAAVAVIDTGVDATPPELATKIRRSINLDSDPNDGPASVDNDGHGTHVASLACAASDNEIGIAGAGLDCGLFVIKSDLSDGGVAQAIVDAANANVDAINMSFGTDDRANAPQAIVDAIDYAFSRGIPMVAAAANKQTAEQGDPANVLQPSGTGPGIDNGRGLSVAAAAADGSRASFSGVGSQISIAAYGTFAEPGGPPGLLGAFPSNTTSIEVGSLLTAPPTPPCRCRTTFDGDNRYAYLQGTSMATPQVAGTAALIHHLNPGLGAKGTIKVLKETARRPAGAWTPELGWGILDAGAALRAARDIDATPPLSSVAAPPITHQTSITLGIRASDPVLPGVKSTGVDVVKVYRSTYGGAGVKIATTRQTRLRVKVRRGSRYAFWTEAIDRAGNVEAAPRTPDARTRVART